MITDDGPGLCVLVIDDEQPARDEVAYLLGLDARVATVLTSGSATEALRALHEDAVDAVFLDVQMPGLSGLELAAVLNRFASPPPVVFVTAHETHAVEAFDLHAVDYVLKPVRADRLAEAVRRVLAGRDQGPPPSPALRSDQQIPVELGGVTRFLDRAEITHVEAQGDYARLYTAEGSHLVRVPLSTLEADWAEAGFLRVHRSVLVSLGHVREVRMDQGRCSVVVAAPGAGDGAELQVSRRHTRELRERLVRRTGS